MKKAALIVSVLLVALILCACGECDHQWSPATCTSPQTCEKCGISNGTPLGHDWIQTDPSTRTCSRCGIKETLAAAPEAAPAEADTPVEAPATPEPTPVITHWYDDHVTRMSAQSAALEIPGDMYFLDEPEQKTILGEKGVCIYELYAPYKDAEQIGKINNGNVVSVLARKNDYALFVTSGGLYAWGSNRLIVDGNDTPYLVSGKSDTGKSMVMSHSNKVYVLYDPYGIFPYMTTMNPNTPVTAYKTVNGFTYVETGSIKGWVNSSFLT